MYVEVRNYLIMLLKNDYKKMRDKKIIYIHF